jgi:hypothetical protein
MQSITGSAKEACIVSEFQGGNSGAKPVRSRWPAIGALMVLLLAVVAGVIYSWAHWGAGRTDRSPQSAVDFHKAKKAFLAEIEAGRQEAAYQSTTASFRGRVSQQAFSERADRYRACKQKPGVRGVEGSAGDTLWGDHGPRQQVFTNTLEDRQGTSCVTRSWWCGRMAASQHGSRSLRSSYPDARKASKPAARVRIAVGAHPNARSPL